MATPVTIVAGGSTAGLNAGGAGSSGRHGQSHLVYAANQSAWWIFYLSGTQSLDAVYSSTFASWTAPTGSPLTLIAAHGSEGRDFGFAYANLASTDVLHMTSAYAPGVSAKKTYHARFTL